MGLATGSWATARHTYMQALYAQVLGASGAISTLNTGDQVTNFVDVLSTTPALDPVITILSQMIGRTLMAVRPYKGKLDTIEVDREAYGWITRKLSFIEDTPQANLTFTLTDGQSIDPWIVRKPKVIETRKYGGGQISRVLTVYEDQIKGAFASASGLDEFLSGMMTWFNAGVEQDREQYKRTALINYMACLSTYPDRVIYLIDEYNSATGSALDATTVFAPANFEGFTQWLYGFIQKIMGLLSERSFKYHLNPINAVPNAGYIARQTRYEDMRCFFNMGFKEDMTARVVSNTFNKEELKEVKYEGINFWQSIDDPTDIDVTVNPVGDDLFESPSASVALSNVFGVIFDRDALAVSYMNDNTGNSPYNQRGRYYNLIHNEDVCIAQDLTENGILLLLDKHP